MVRNGVAILTGGTAISVFLKGLISTVNGGNDSCVVLPTWAAVVTLVFLAGVTACAYWALSSDEKEGNRYDR